MTAALQLCKMVALVALTVLLVSLTLAVRSISPTLEKLSNTVELANRTIGETGEAVTNLRDASRAWNHSSAAQAKAVLETEREARKSFVDFDLLIAHTDFQLNQQVLPQIGHAVEVNSTQLVELEKITGPQLAKVAADTDLMLQAATRDLDDPAIAASLKQIEVTTQNVAATTEHVAETTQVLEDYTKRLTKPASMLKQIALGALQYGYQFRGLFGL